MVLIICQKENDVLVFDTSLDKKELSIILNLYWDKV